MLERLKNFFLYGLLVSDEDMHWDEDSRQGRRLASEKKRKENQNKEPLVIEREDKKAIFFAALSVFGPLVLVLLIIIVIAMFITARYF